MFVGIIGGFLACIIAPDIPLSEFIIGLRAFFVPIRILYTIVKSIVYVFLIATISGYFGYNVKGGALEVGEASTHAVVMSNVSILISDLLLTQLMLT